MARVWIDPEQTYYSSKGAPLSSVTTARGNVTPVGVATALREYVAFYVSNATGWTEQDITREFAIKRYLWGQPLKDAIREIVRAIEAQLY